MAIHLSSVLSGLREIFQGGSTAGQLASVPEESTTISQGSSTSTAGKLASVPEESTTTSQGSSTDALPPPNFYRDSIRRVSVVCPEWRIRSTLSSQSGSTNSSASRSKSSGYSSNSASMGAADLGNTELKIGHHSVSVSAADLGTTELTEIAQRMATDGYTQRMAQAFHAVSLKRTFGRERALRNWFVELDVDWVLDLRLQTYLQQSANLLQELTERWIRALTIIVASVDEELVTTTSDAPTAGRFVVASVSAMLVFVDVIIQVNMGQQLRLQAMLQLYICVCSASYGILPMQLISMEAQSIFDDINSSLDREGNKLIESICDTMVQVRRRLMKDANSWATEIPRGRGEVHWNTRLMVDYIVLMSKAHASTQKNSVSHNTGKLADLIQYTIDYLNSLLLQKSELCSDPSLRYLFLLNNSYFIAQRVSKTSVSLNPELWGGDQRGLKLNPECETYMDNYLHVSWERVINFIPKPNLHGPLRRWTNTTSLAKFYSAFDNTYQPQKYWKVPEPRLRSLLRENVFDKPSLSHDAPAHCPVH